MACLPGCGIVTNLPSNTQTVCRYRSVTATRESTTGLSILDRSVTETRESTTALSILDRSVTATRESTTALSILEQAVVCQLPDV